MKTDVTEEQKEHLESLIESGEKLEAIRYAQQTFHLDAEQAITMVERLEKDLEGESDAELERATKELTASTAKLPGIIGGTFTVVGVILIALATYFGYGSYSFLQEAVAVPGIVKEFKEREVRNTDRDSDTYGNMYTLFSPILQYHYEGKDYTFESPYGSSAPAYAIGDQIPLLVNPVQPDHPEEDSFMNNWFVTMLLGALGLIFAGVGMIVMRAFKKSEPIYNK